ncbi:MAG: ATP-binding protein, partial [Bacteroidetes bacterium]|nr:ATP-binding protein [Bacteroidota bacterium]
MKLKNPFILSGYQSPQYFCDRTKETKKIVSAIENQRNLTLFSLRRLGKTALIHHVFYLLNKRKDYQTVYCDIMPTSNLSDFVDTFGTAVARKFGKDPIPFYKKLSYFFTKIRP